MTSLHVWVARPSYGEWEYLLAAGGRSWWTSPQAESWWRA